MEHTIQRTDPRLAPFADMLATESHHTHQILLDRDGTPRWKPNDGVVARRERLDMNELVPFLGALGLTRNSELFRHLYRCLGYSLNGYWEIFYSEENNPDVDDYIQPARNLVELAQRLGERFDAISEKAMGAHATADAPPGKLTGDTILYTGHGQGLGEAIDLVADMLVYQVSNAPGKSILPPPPCKDLAELHRLLVNCYEDPLLPAHPPKPARRGFDTGYRVGIAEAAGYVKDMLQQ